MTDELIFYTNPMSRGQIVRWMLEEVGAPYEPRILGYGTTMKDAEYLAINPMGKVPAVVHDGKVVTECAAICAYLADAFPEAGLAPDVADRADYYRWLFFTSGPVEQARRSSRATASAPPTSMSAARSTGGCSSAPSRRVRRSKPMSRPCANGPRTSARRRSTMR